MRRRFWFAISILAATHLYIWWRLVLPLPSPVWQLATTMLLVLGPSFPATLFVGRRLPRDRARPWLLVGYLWFGFATYLLLGAAGSHLATACGVNNQHAALAGIAAAAIVVIGGLVKVARAPTVVRVRVPIPKLPVDAYRIVQLTDVHIGPLIGREYATKVVQAVNALDADAVVITGDFVDGRLSELREHIEPFRGMRAKHGVFSVTGNHEYYWNAPAWLEHIRSLGIHLLRNEHVVVGGAVTLAGVDDSTASEDVPRAVADHDPRLPLVLLAHHPRTVARAVQHGVDLQLSGHTHGGQLLPLGWLARLFDPLVSGLRRFGGTWLYVSHGTGFWGPPMRVGTRCEVTEITLVPERA